MAAAPTQPVIDASPISVSSSFIPNDKPPRTVVLCFDGTGDQFDADNSNVVQFFSMLKKDDKNEQIVYYQAGIGTYTTPQIATPGMAKISKTLDEMIAWNLDAHVMSGYEFLMQNYQVGDKICIFGFSRGAYTARALAGMVHKVGLLPAYNNQQVPFAYKMYTKADETGWKQSTAFKKAFSIDVDIDFLGVWDTVCSVGLIPRRLPFTASNTAIKVFRHAVSLDERRAKFKANLFNRPTETEAQLGIQPGEMPKSSVDDAAAVPDVAVPSVDVKVTTTTNGVSGVGSAIYKNVMNAIDPPSKQSKKKPRPRDMEREFSEHDGCNFETDVLEVWFAGCHCDVGGGSVSNDAPHNLARIPLRWMIRQCFKTKTGIRFHTDLLPTVGLNPKALWPDVIPRPAALPNSAITSIPTLPSVTDVSHTRTSTSATLVDYVGIPPPLPIGGGVVSPLLTEEQEDLLDIRTEIYDQLSIAKYWWILEISPMFHRYQKEDDKWDWDLTVNLGQGRVVPDHVQYAGLHIHRTVKTRMEADDLPQGRYVPKARFAVEPIWED